MSTVVQESDPRAQLIPGKKYRFYARTAEEAVQIIHDRMGPQARVVAVEQVGGQGLGRLLRGTRLEVIAMLPLELTGGTKAADAGRPAGSVSRGAGETTAEPGPRVSSRVPYAEARAAARRHGGRGAAGEAGADHSLPDPEFGSSPREVAATGGREASVAGTFEERIARARSSRAQEAAEGPSGPRDLRSILRRLGFSAELLAQFAATANPQELGRVGWASKLDRFIEFLWSRYQQLPTRAMTDQVAFFGTPGSGITTALCKELTASVFLRGEQPLVSCLELDRPSSPEALSAFCELMQVPLVSEERGAMGPAERVFWDIPGISSRDFDTWDEVGARLDELLIQTRVFVTHAAFDTQHLVQLLRTVEAVRPTHLVLTHLDEATQPARLWDFVQDSGLCPLFAGESPSVTGGRREDFHAALLAQIFPAYLNPRA